MEKRILLVGGGSGGHVYPLFAVADLLREKAITMNVELKLMALGEGSFLVKAAKENNIPYKIISAGKLRRYSSWETLKDIFIKVPISFVQSLWYIFWFMPDIVFAKGGYASVAPVIVAKIFFITVYVHESDTVPGLANTILGKIADRIFVSFKTTEKYFEGNDVIFTGNPVRKKLMEGNKENAWKFFNFHEPRKTILILGGSQGAQVINEVILSSLVVMTQKFNVIHQCGESQYAIVKSGVDTILKEGTRQYSEPVHRYYRFHAFFNENELSMAYAVADIIVSRAGAGNIFEIAQVGKPAIIVPITKSSANHQYLNAFEFSLAGAHMIEEKDFNRESLVREIDRIINPEIYSQMSEKVKTFATPDAADTIATELLK